MENFFLVISNSTTFDVEHFTISKLKKKEEESDFRAKDGVFFSSFELLVPRVYAHSHFVPKINRLNREKINV